MSTIAFDGKTMAADKQSTDNSIRRSCSKIRRITSGELLAGCGPHGMVNVMMAWYENGADLTKYPAGQLDKEDWAILIVVNPATGKCVEYGKHPAIMEFDASPWAWGSGREFALAAMHCGYDATRAIGVAAHFDTNTGIGVDVFAVQVLAQTS